MIKGIHHRDTEVTEIMINKIISPNSVKFARLSLLVSALCVLCASVVNISAQDWKTVAAGVEYAEVRREFSGKPVDINLLRLDPKKVRLDVRHAMDTAIGTEKTSSIAVRHKAFAAINAGFFRLDTSVWAGDPAGILMIDGKLWSESQNNRVSLNITNQSNRTVISIGHTNAVNKIAYFTDVSDTLDGVNRERKPSEMIVYTPQFGRSTLTSNEGTELILSECSSLCHKVQVLEKSGNSNIPSDGYVISIGANPTARQQFLIDHMTRDGDPSLKSISVLTKLILIEGGKETKVKSTPEDITNGVPQLIKNSKIDITWEQEKASKSFVETRHPRTAVAKLKDGKFLMLTADGRSELSAGLDLYDLAAYFLELGATDAMNLDGGGSTTMFLDGKVVNKPSDKEGERKVSDAILVTLRKRK